MNDKKTITITMEEYKLLLEKQKQVDELKTKQVIECHGMLKGCDMVNQAVKDTAKEIIVFVEEKDKKAGKYSIYRTLLQELKEKYEVE